MSSSFNLKQFEGMLLKSKKDTGPDRKEILNFVKKGNRSLNNGYVTLIVEIMDLAHYPGENGFVDLISDLSSMSKTTYEILYLQISQGPKDLSIYAHVLIYIISVVELEYKINLTKGKALILELFF